MKHVNRQVKKPGTTVRPHSAVVCLIAWLTERLHIPDHDGIKTAKALSFTVSVRESLPALAVSCALTMTIKDEGGDWLL